MAEINYKRNQAEDALWAVFASRHGGAKVVPSAFVTRIKRLLEIDRAEPVSRGSAHAFSEGPGCGKGRDSAFTEFNCVCVAIGLDMLDIGFKQREIVTFLRTHRQTIEKEIDFMLMLGEGHPSQRKNRFVTKPRNDDSHDPRLYMIVHKLELTDALPDMASNSSKDRHATRRPVFGHGLKELAGKLDRLTKKGQAYRSYIVMEIGTMIETLLIHLANTPAKKRGRS
jgi:hypothetical protein